MVHLEKQLHKENGFQPSMNKFYCFLFSSNPSPHFENDHEIKVAFMKLLSIYNGNSFMFKLKRITTTFKLSTGASGIRIIRCENTKSRTL